MINFIFYWYKIFRLNSMLIWISLKMSCIVTVWMFFSNSVNFKRYFINLTNIYYINGLEEFFQDEKYSAHIFFNVEEIVFQAFQSKMQRSDDMRYYFIQHTVNFIFIWIKWICIILNLFIKHLIDLDWYFENNCHKHFITYS